MSAASATLHALRAHTTELDPALAVATLRRELEADSASAVLLFCSDDYDLERLGPAIADSFAAPVAACTSAGQIGAGGFERGGISGVSLRSGDLAMHPHLLAPLSLCQSQAQSIGRQHAARAEHRAGLRSFGVLLVDGSSMYEEFVASALYEALGNVPIVGGSAAPRAQRQHAGVYHAGRFHESAAVVALFETRSLNFGTFAAQHFVPSNKKLVITRADPERRIVYEINGEPAARAYANALQLDEASLEQLHFACHPLLLDLGEQLFPRAIRAKNADGSLLLACAIEEGLVVSVADSLDPVATLELTLAKLNERVPSPEVLLVFDCVLRRIELEARGLDVRVGELLARRGAAGFSGWGEQLGPLHTNHTLTGIALAAPRKKGRD
jgi:hypothetical protein